VDDPPELGGFADVDAAPAPGALAGYLDAVREVGAVAEWKRRGLEALRPRPGLTLVDLGCGTGEDVVALAVMVAPGGRAMGIDASATMIAEARRRAAGRDDVEFRVGDARALDLPDASVDGVRAERVLLHMDDPFAVVAEMARVTRPGGRVVVAEPDWGTLAIDAPGADAGRAVAAAGAARFRAPTSGRSLRRLLIEAGLVDVEVAARTLVIDDPARAEAVFQIADAARHAVRDGRLTEAGAEHWMRGVATAGAAGTLLVAMTAFMASGTRTPDRPAGIV